MINDNFLASRKIQDIGRWYVTRFIKHVADSLPEGASILDAGAGECAYKHFFSHCKYQAIDLAVGECGWNYSNLDYVAPLHAMPIEDNAFDAVLCTQVFEHLEWPRESAKEIYRVIKPGGKLYLTVPMAHAEHQAPYDFFRYTSYGIHSICKHAGFSEIKIAPFGGVWARWAAELPRGLLIFPSSGLFSGNPNAIGMALLPIKVFATGMMRLFQILFLWLDSFDNKRDDPLGWSCEATK